MLLSNFHWNAMKLSDLNLLKNYKHKIEQSQHKVTRKRRRIPWPRWNWRGAQERTAGKEGEGRVI